MKNGFLHPSRLMIGMVLVGTLALLLNALFASHTSQSGGQSQHDRPLTPTSTATPTLAGQLTPSLTVSPEIAEQIFPSPTFSEQPPSLAYLYSEEVMAIEGKILAQGENMCTTPNSLLKSYRLEELELPKSISIRIDGTKTQISVAWRLTIQGGPFRAGAQDWVIWLDDVQMGWAIINWDGSEISTVIIDRSQLRNGSVIFASYGTYGGRFPLGILELIDESK